MSQHTVKPTTDGKRQIERLEGLATMANYQRNHPHAYFTRAESIDWGRRWTVVVQSFLAARYLMTLAETSPQWFALRSAAWDLLQHAKRQAADIHGRYPNVVDMEVAC